jgi:sulfotransferase family protein
VIQLDKHYQRPDWVRRLNYMGESVLGAQRLVPLDVAALVEQARAATGLDDFGSFDGDWRGRLERLVVEIERTAQLHVVGRLMTRQEILRGLISRLLLAQRHRMVPAIAQEKIEKPIVIAGPGRSGTTILHELLWLDPDARSPLGYESLQPVPPAALAGDAHRRVAECEQELWADVQPEFAAIHELAAHLPMECIAIQQPSFGGYHWSMVADVPGVTPDFAAAMAYHRAALQSLQHGQPRRTWVLKTPVYQMMIDLLWETYPDARVIMTHRDPVKWLPSGLSTLATVRWLRSDHVPLTEMQAYGGGLLMLMLMQREQAGSLPGKFVHVHFASLLRDPAATMERLYNELGRPFRAEHADRIRDYLSHKPKGKFGAHKYSPEDWGLDAAKIRRELAPYMDYYQVARED